MIYDNEIRLVGLLEEQVLNGALLIHYFRFQALTNLTNKKEYMEVVRRLNILYGILDKIVETANRCLDTPGWMFIQRKIVVSTSKDYRESADSIKRDIVGYLQTLWKSDKENEGTEWENSLLKQWTAGRGVKELAPSETIEDRRKTLVAIYHKLRRLWGIVPLRRWEEATFSQGKYNRTTLLLTADFLEVGFQRAIEFWEHGVEEDWVNWAQGQMKS